MFNPLIIMFLINSTLSYLVMSNIMIEDVKYVNHNLNKFYMSLFMASLMGLAELILMGDHLVPDGQAIYYSATLLILTLLSTFAIRQQFLINDNQFLKSMIEHHASALLMSKQALKSSQNSKVRQLANQITDSQSQEIQLMQSLIN
jgi:hypothetical protein